MKILLMVNYYLMSKSLKCHSDQSFHSGDVALFVTLYRVTQNKVHHILATLYLIFEVNFTQVFSDIQRILTNEVQLKKSTILTIPI